MLLQTLKQTHQFGVGIIYRNSFFAEAILLAKCHGCLEHITMSLPAISNTKFGLPLNGNAKQPIFQLIPVDHRAVGAGTVNGLAPLFTDNLLFPAQQTNTKPGIGAHTPTDHV